MDKYSAAKSAKLIWKCISENDAAGLVGHYTKDLECPARAAPHNTPMLVAVMSKKWDVVRRLLDLNAVGGINDYMQSPLGEALIKKAPDDILDAMLKKIDKNIIDNDVFISSLIADNWEVAKGCLEKTKDLRFDGKKVINECEITKDSWDKFREDAKAVPPIVAISENNISRMLYSLNKAEVGGTTFQYAVLGTKSEDIKIWAEENGLSCDATKTPMNERLLYTMIAFHRKHYDKLQHLLTADPDQKIMADQKLLAWHLMCMAMMKNDLDMAIFINEIAKEKWSVDLWSVRRVYLHDDISVKESDEAVFVKKNEKRDYHPIFDIVKSIARLERIDRENSVSLANQTPFSLSNVTTKHNPSKMWSGKKIRDVEIETLKGIISNGVSVNFEERGWGQTLLHIASALGSEELVGVLLELGADIEIKSGVGKRGRTARVIAQQRGHTNVQNIIEAFELKKNCKVGKLSEVKKVSSL